MAVLTILKVPHPFLKKKVKKVQEITPEVLRILDDIAETMYYSNGIGLAASQVGIDMRLVTIDVSTEERKSELLKLINPEIIEGEGELIMEEGCLSVPEIRDEVKRYKKIKAKYLDINGEERIIEDDGLIARVIQHEIDHLDGIVFLDRLSPLKKALYYRRLKKEAKKRKNELRM
ncbi:MAG: peptide deformylase [Deltaproteobacteria bacterium]|nr:peptide deformylase [Deltaproteobacteria bacterium]